MSENKNNDVIYEDVDTKTIYEDVDTKTIYEDVSTDNNHYDGQVEPISALVKFLYNKTQNKDENKEGNLIKSLLNGKAPLKLTEVPESSCGYEEVLSFSPKILKNKLFTLNNEDYDKIIKALDKGYNLVEKSIQEALETGHNEFINPIQDNEHYYSVGMQAIEKIILETKREKEYSFNQKILKKLKNNYDMVTNTDLKITRFISNRSSFNLVVENSLNEENLIKSVERLSKTDFFVLQEKVVSGLEDEKSHKIAKTTVILESLAKIRNESLSESLINTMSFYLNKNNTKEEIENVKNSCSVKISKNK